MVCPPGADARPIDEAVNPLEVAKNEALAQIAARADVVDVELDLPDAEQETLLPRMIEAVQQSFLEMVIKEGVNAPLVNAV